MPYHMQSTQYRYTPDIHEEEGPVFCGVCGTQATETRGCYGPRGLVQGMSGTKSHYDCFECPNRDQDWHRQALAIRMEAKKSPSKIIEQMLLKEALEIIEKREATKQVHTFY